MLCTRASNIYERLTVKGVCVWGGMGTALMSELKSPCASLLLAHLGCSMLMWQLAQFQPYLGLVLLTKVSDVLIQRGHTQV